MFWYYFPEIHPKRKLEKIKKNTPGQGLSEIESCEELYERMGKKFERCDIPNKFLLK